MITKTFIGFFRLWYRLPCHPITDEFRLQQGVDQYSHGSKVCPVYRNLIGVYGVSFGNEYTGRNHHYLADQSRYAYKSIHD
jgi:hypothetical protein